MVRKATVVLSVIGLLWQTAACSSASPTNDGAGAQPSVSVPSVPPRPDGVPASPPPSPETSSAPPKATPSRSRPSGPAGTSASDEVPGPLPWGVRTLTGIVERSPDCTMLLVVGRRWALTGAAAAALSPGARVTVRGNLTTRPAGCGDRDLAQTIAVTRVEPA